MPLPLHILEPIKEEIIDESVPEQEDKEGTKADEKISENGQMSAPVKYEEITIQPKNPDAVPKLGDFSLA